MPPLNSDGTSDHSAGALRVLAYHRIAVPADTPDLDPSLISATPEVFTSQMRYLACNFHAVSVMEVLEAVDAGRPLPRRSVLLTFDDAYRDFAQNAWPILLAFNLPAVLFVPTAYPGSGKAFWWDRLYKAIRHTRKESVSIDDLVVRLVRPADRERALLVLKNRVKNLKSSEVDAFVNAWCVELGDARQGGDAVLTWSELRDLIAQGLDVGAHTRTHPIMTRLTPEPLRDEVAGSLEDMKRETGSLLPVFCYPNGAANDDVVEVLRRQGVRLAFTTLDGHNRLNSQDLLRLRRTMITPRTSPGLLRLRLTTPFAYVDMWRHRSNRVA